MILCYLSILAALMKTISSIFLSLFICAAWAQKPASKASAVQMVNVFLGSSGDHGQMSPGASSPFGMMSIAPQTYPNLHMGYEHKARVFLGFTHNRFEGVGCQGSGGNIMIKPFVGTDAAKCILQKSTESAGPGFYKVAFTNGIKASFAVNGNSGIEEYAFPSASSQAFYIDLSHTLANRFVAEEHQAAGNFISGWVDSRTTCSVGTYRVYYYIQFDEAVAIRPAEEHQLIATLSGAKKQAHIRISFSSVDVAHARAALNTGTVEQLLVKSQQAWAQVLNAVQVQGLPERTNLFYSLLYRTVQSPYVISEPDGSYRAVDGSLQHSDKPVYNGWSVWDNYRTQLPLLSVLYSGRYQQITNSLANLYPYGKKNYATQHEPSNTVRTEHTLVVLLDAWRKGYHFNFDQIADSLMAEADRLDYGSPDKALESSYDAWAMGQLLKLNGKNDLASKYLQKASEYKRYWNKDFKDINRPDVDRMQARGIYQGTIWQYRWFVPFDLQGLKELTGGEKTYQEQLDHFFDNDLYNHANEPDIQAPLMYNVTPQPWKSQALMHKYAADTVVQYYFNDNSRGIDPFIDRIYTNRPDTYIRTMDDDAGAMSAWYVFAACGFSPACVGWPVYYLNVPLFKQVIIHHEDKPFIITVKNFGPDRRYIQAATLNGKPYNRNWISQDDLMKGGSLVITAGDTPNQQWGIHDQWVTGLDK